MSKKIQRRRNQDDVKISFNNDKQVISNEQIKNAELENEILEQSSEIIKEKITKKTNLIIEEQNLNVDQLCTFPPEVILTIIKYLDAVSIYNIARTCKTFKQIIYYDRHFLMQKNWWNNNCKRFAFSGNGNAVTCLQFNSKKIISGSDDYCIYTYEIPFGRLINTFKGHKSRICSLQYIQNILISGSADKTICIWDLSNGVCMHVLKGHTSTVTCLQIITSQNVNLSPLIITGSKDSTLKIWCLPILKTNQIHQLYQLNDKPYLIHTLQDHTDSVCALAGEGNILVSGSDDQTVRTWDIKTGKCIRCLRGHKQGVHSVVLIATKKRCVSGSMDGAVKAWNLEDGTNLWTVDGLEDIDPHVDYLHFFNGHIISAVGNSRLCLLDPENGSIKMNFSTSNQHIKCFYNDIDKIVFATSNAICLGGIEIPNLINQLSNDLSDIWQVKFDDRYCITAVNRYGDTFFEIFDFGIYGIMEPNPKNENEEEPSLSIPSSPFESETSDCTWE